MIKKNYYPHIDGLRAVAVLSVIIFHINKKYMPGGFVGVDIFFVISGFLITKIIYLQMKEYRFTIKNFYLKRMKRILPVYFLVSSLTFLCTWILYFPEDFESYSRSLLASNAFVSNLYFWQSVDYFSQNSDYFPLLHTWSLSVEEQFYIFWPIFLFFIVRKIGKNWNLGLILSVIIVSSIIISVYFSIYYPNFAYYSLFTRGFELMLGASAAIYSGKINKLKRYFSVMNYIGFSLIIFSVIFINRSFLFPGWIALLPTIGTVFLLHPSPKENLVIRSLSSSVFVEIGVISYSLYMWHWPILVFLRYYFIKPNSYQLAAAVTLIFFISYISCHYFERKIIKSHFGFNKSLLLLFLLPTIILSSSALHVITASGIPERFDTNMISKFLETKSTSNICSYEHLTFNIDDRCIFKFYGHKNKPTLKILLWGDSHANHFIPFFKELNKFINYELVVQSFPGCPPIPGVYRINRSYSESCYRHNIKVQEHLINDEYNLVLLAANWVNYTKGANLGDVSSRVRTIENSKRAMFENLQNLFTVLSESRVNFLVLGSVPNFEINPAECELKYAQFKSIDKNLCYTDTNTLLKRRQDFDLFMKDQSKKFNFNYIDFVKYFCDEAKCTAQVNGIQMYSDKNHLSEIGAKKLFNLSLNEFSFMGLQDN